MRITRIDLAGDNGTFAILRRKPGSTIIEVEILIPGKSRTLTANVRYENEQSAVATALQEALDGCRGTNSMIHDYYRLIQQLGD